LNGVVLGAAGLQALAKELEDSSLSPKLPIAFGLDDDDVHGDPRRRLTSFGEDSSSNPFTVKVAVLYRVLPSFTEFYRVVDVFFIF